MLKSENILYPKVKENTSRRFFIKFNSKFLKIQNEIKNFIYKRTRIHVKTRKESHITLSLTRRNVALRAVRI